MPDDLEAHTPFLRLYVEHEPALRGYVRSLVPTSQDAQDVMQEVAAALWKRFHTLSSPEDFRRWAFGVARLETLVLTAGLPMLSDRARCRVPDSAAASPAIMVTNIFWKRLITGPPFRFLAEAVDEQPMWDMSADQLHQGRVQQEHERGEGQDHFRDGEPGRCRCRGLLFLGLQLMAEGLRPGHQRAVNARAGDTGGVRAINVL